MTNHLNRRILLKGLGGAVIAAPFLSSLLPRSARAQAEKQTQVRTIVMFTHYGCITNKWFPAKLDGDLTADDLTATNLAALAPFAKKLLMPRGMRTMNEWTASNKGAGKGRGQGNDSHTQIAGSVFTCQPVTPNSNDPFSFTAATKFNAMPIGPSLDHVMAKQLSPMGAPLFMNVNGQSKESAQSAISYSASETIFTALTATQAYSSLTKLFQTGMPMNADTYAIKKGQAIADIVKGDLNRLMSKDMSKADKDKLAAWLELANDVTKVVASAECTQTLAMTLGASNKLGTSGMDNLTRKVSDTMDNADLYSAIAALTAACDANPVIFLKYPNNFTFSGLGINADSHNQSHRLSNANMQGPCVADAVANLQKIDTYYATKFANLVKMLDSVPEGSGTVLDNSTAVWINEMSDGNAHNLNNTPVIQAGSGGGYFKTGKIVNLDVGTTGTATDYLGRSLSQCVDGTPNMSDGVNQGTGTKPELGNQPINKYFCNIMNAAGMKADAMGFPAKDGPASEVTHFGYSDKTEDFSGGAGAVSGATIHNPGAYTELKAS